MGYTIVEEDTPVYKHVTLESLTLLHMYIFDFNRFVVQFMEDNLYEILTVPFVCEHAVLRVVFGRSLVCRTMIYF